MSTGVPRLSTHSLSALFFALLSVVPAVSQHKSVQPEVLRNPDVRHAVYSDVSQPLRDMASQSLPQAGLHLAPPVRTQPARPGQVQLKDGAMQTLVGAPVAATIGLNLLGVGNGFNGYTVPDAPTDVNLAVGDTQVVQWVNTSYAVFDKTSGAVIAGPIEGNVLWSGFGGLCQSDNSGDIIAQWDKLAHRWFLTQNTFQSGYDTCIAVSQTTDATGAYYRFAFTQPGFPDYPKWGIMPDAYYQTQNNFGDGGAAYACAYDRNKMLAGDSSAAQICFQAGAADFSLLPGDLDSVNTPPPSGQQEVLLGSINSSTGTQVYEYLFHVDFTTPANSTFTGTNLSMPITVASYSLGCGGNGACIPQEGSADNLDSLGDRLMYRLAYRNFGDHQTWLVSHSVTAGSSVGERWYEFHAAENSTALSVYQQSTFAPDGNFRWMGSLAMDQNQNIALGYSESSSSMFPGIYYTGRTLSDPLNTMEGETLIVAGTGSQTDTSNRWGDYTSMAIDAADDCTFWYTNQYYQTTTTFDWSTRLASLKFPGCGSTTPDFYLSPSPSFQTIFPGGSASYSITVNPIDGYSKTVTLSLTGCPTGATCNLNPTSVGPPYTASTLSISTSGIAPGNYLLTITGSDGTITHTTNVTLSVTDYSVTALPATRTVKRSTGTAYQVTVTSLNGFGGTVAMSLSGLPAGATSTFNPATVVGHGTPVLSIATTKKTPVGTFTLTIIGTSGSATRKATVSLTVKTH